MRAVKEEPVVVAIKQESEPMFGSRLSRYAGPYPQWKSPTEAACRLVTERLAVLHGSPSVQRRQGPQVGCEERSSVLDSLVRTLLSQNTTDVTSSRAFANLKQCFPSWEVVRSAPLPDVADAIRVGGLAEIKAGRIQAILSILAAERGTCSLEHLRSMSVAEAKADLSRFKGVGKKTVACTLLFALELPEFAVDTHVLEISKALGWVPCNASRDQAYDHLNELVPDELKYDLHVLLVNHGKHCLACAKAGSAKQRLAAASAVDCPLADLKLPPSKLKTAMAAGAKQRGKNGAGTEGGATAAAAAGPAAAGKAAGGTSKRRKMPPKEDCY